MALSPGSRIGGYEVLGLVGAGGMGEVYRGRDPKLQRDVAIKVITADADPETVRRFETEALSVSALNHPNILTVHEFGRHEGQPYLVTEFIDGKTLRARLQHGPISIAETLDIAVQVASAIDGAHTSGIIHRDIKPENVMLRPDGYIKVLDFGVAKLTPTAQAAGDKQTVSMHTTPGMLIGTVGYMSPEQVRGQPLDERSDVWSLGVVLHEMVSGRSPFAGSTGRTGGTMSDVIAAVLERQPPPLTTASGGPVPSELARIISKALEKDRAERYQTVRDLLTDLRRLKREIDRGSGETPPTVVAPATTPSANRRRLAAMLMLGLIGAIVAGVIGWFSWVSSHPMKTIDYWLTVQRVRGGVEFERPFESSGLENFENGWKFRFNIQSRNAGFLYLVNQGPGATGQATVNFLYPTPAMRNGSAAVAAGEHFEIPQTWYQLDDNPGVEQFWIVWSSAEVQTLEKAKRWVNAADLGHVKDAGEAQEILRLLETNIVAPTTLTENAATRMSMSGRGAVLASRVNLRHR
jgi:serine/threonine protein kinase